MDPFFLAENTNLLTKKGKNKKNTTNVLRKNNEKSMKKMYLEKILNATTFYYEHFTQLNAEANFMLCLLMAASFHLPPAFQN